MAADGSCLFNSMTMAVEGVDNKSDEIRSTIAAIILSDEVKYNKQFLGGALEPMEYAEHICKPGEWGGIPELHILSEMF